jgi:hypothetical protein
VILLPGTYALGGDTLYMGQIEVHGQNGKPPPKLVSTAMYTAVSAGPGTLRRVVIDSTTSGSFALFSSGAGLVEQVFAHTTGANSRACYPLGTALLRDTVCWSSGGYALSVQAGGVATHAPTARNVTAIATGVGGIGINVDSGFGSIMSLNAVNTIASGPAGDATATTDSMGGTATLTLVSSAYATQGETGTGATVTDPGTGNNVTGAPLFVNAAAGNFYEKVGSPTINAGSGAGQLGQFDIDGQSRVQGAAPDIGADEFDEIAPQTRITGGPKAKTGKRRATFRFTSNEAGSSVQCKLDKKRFSPCSRTKTYRNLKPGKHTFRVRAEDATGNLDKSPAKRSWTVLP